MTGAYTRAVQALHPGMPVFPEMSTGASDARPFRVAGIPVYGVNGGWAVVPIDNRAHGQATSACRFSRCTTMSCTGS